MKKVTFRDFARDIETREQLTSFFSVHKPRLIDVIRVYEASKPDDEGTLCPRSSDLVAVFALGAYAQHCFNEHGKLDAVGRMAFDNLARFSTFASGQLFANRLVKGV